MYCHGESSGVLRGGPTGICGIPETVMANAQVMADEFIARGYKVVSGGTDNHLMLIDLRTKFPDVTGRMAEQELENAPSRSTRTWFRLTTVPLQNLRFRVAAVTSRGFVEKDMKDMVELIDMVLTAVAAHRLRQRCHGRGKGCLSGRTGGSAPQGTQHDRRPSPQQVLATGHIHFPAVRQHFALHGPYFPALGIERTSLHPLPDSEFRTRSKMIAYSW